MDLKKALQKHTIYQHYKNWYVLNDDFNWNVKSLYKTIFKHMDFIYDTPVIFCSTLEANKIISALGDEENEYLRYESGVYWRELGIIFIFCFDEHISLIETLFHEFRHVMQDHNPIFRHYFESDKKLPYKERVTEIDAFHFAKEKTIEFLTAI
ncbi:DUF3920 family protein [Niallia sp. XMNu-256]|uniref:DUF3920 family protein n=1 Tax=Niallia sp. XMNu-256 TaxID=3082444 RepID=UPI0030CDECE5